MGSFTDYAETQILNHTFGGISLPVFTAYAGYFLTTPGETGPGSEPAGGGYARVALDSSYWSVPTTGMIQSTKDIVFPRATANHGNVVGIGIWDSAIGGNCWVYANLVDTEVIENKDSLIILSGGITHTFSPGGWGYYLQNAILSHIYRAIPAALAPTVYAAYCTSAPSATAFGTEPGGTYARIPVANNMSNFTAVSGGIKSNAVPIEFPLSSTTQGTVSHLGFLTASTGGELLAYGALNPSKAVDINDQLVFLTGDVTFSLD